jgi:hypothetical protein
VGITLRRREGNQLVHHTFTNHLSRVSPYVWPTTDCLLGGTRWLSHTCNRMINSISTFVRERKATCSHCALCLLTFSTSPSCLRVCRLRSKMKSEIPGAKKKSDVLPYRRKDVSTRPHTYSDVQRLCGHKSKQHVLLQHNNTSCILSKQRISTSSHAKTRLLLPSLKQVPF